MKKFILKLILLIPVLLIVVLINYTVDPANLFRNTHSNQDSLSYEEQIVAYLSEGYNVTNVESYNERIFQKSFIESLQDVPEIAVFGSSRSQLIDETFYSQKLINNSVTAATLEDILGLFHVYYRRSMLPDKVIIELSPEILNDNNSSSRWKDLEVEYDSMVTVISEDVTIHKKHFWDIQDITN